MQSVGGQTIVDGAGGRVAFVSADAHVSFLDGERYCPSVSRDGQFWGFVSDGRYQVAERATGRVEYSVGRKSVGRWQPERDEIIVRSDCRGLGQLWCGLLLYQDVVDVRSHSRRPLLLFYSVVNDLGLVWATVDQVGRVAR